MQARRPPTAASSRRRTYPLCRRLDGAPQSGHGTATVEDVLASIRSKSLSDTMDCTRTPPRCGNITVNSPSHRASITIQATERHGSTVARTGFTEILEEPLISPLADIRGPRWWTGVDSAGQSLALSGLESGHRPTRVCVP
ncbi:hypothetical protein GCM10009753_44810 [Streptantibioticus ferralitis]